MNETRRGIYYIVFSAIIFAIGTLLQTLLRQQTYSDALYFLFTNYAFAIKFEWGIHDYIGVISQFLQRLYHFFPNLVAIIFYTISATSLIYGIYLIIKSKYPKAEKP